MPKRCFGIERSPPSLASRGGSPGTSRTLGSLCRNDSAEFGSAEDWVQLAVRRRADGVLIGDVGLRAMGERSDQAEIGFTIAPEHQRRGYASEAVVGVLTTLFGDFEVHRVMASVDPRNEASMALLHKLGFRKEAHHRRSLWFKGEWVDDVIFAMLAEEWRASRER
ncbi:MAG: GNAT family N-acetyltransferase [Planctomycetota bacterium]|jgi:RimJ/RimL family protein N-acetyltransferase